MNTISEGHFPVVYDRELGGYRLLEKTGINYDKLKTDETIIVALALERLSREVNESYQIQIEAILKKLFSSQNFSIEEVWAAFRPKIKLFEQISELSDLLTELIVQTAVLAEGNLSIRVDGENDGKPGTAFECPQLVFDKFWMVSDRKDETRQLIPIQSIEAVQTKR